MCKEDSASAVELGFLYDFWVLRDLVFFNCCRASSSLCPLKISRSAVELGFKDDFWEVGTQFSSTVSQSAGVYGRRRCQRQP